MELKDQTEVAPYTSLTLDRPKVGAPCPVISRHTCGPSRATSQRAVWWRVKMRSRMSAAHVHAKAIDHPCGWNSERPFFLGARYDAGSYMDDGTGWKRLPPMTPTLLPAGGAQLQRMFTSSDAMRRLIEHVDQQP